MDTHEPSDTYVAGGPTEAGVIVIQILAAIAAPLLIIAALIAHSWHLVAPTSVAIAVFVVCTAVARRVPHEFTIRQDTITFKRATGREQSYAKRDVFVEKRYTNVGPDALFHVKHSFASFGFPLDFTTHAESGQLLTLEKLATSGIEVR